MKESKFQAKLIIKLYKMFPGCVILKNDSSYQQGMLDLLILYNDQWAALEVKASASSDKQPNQDHFVKQFGKMSFSSYIHPDNEEEVLDALQQTFKPSRRARVS